MTAWGALLAFSEVSSEGQQNNEGKVERELLLLLACFSGSAAIAAAVAFLPVFGSGVFQQAPV